MRKICLVLFAAATLNAQNKVEQKLNQILEQQTEILNILKAADTPPDTPPLTSLKVDVKDSPVIGDDKAPVTIVEFTDFQCPFCQKFHMEIFPQVRDKLISTGKARFVSKDFPLPAQMHPNALRAAEAGRCAGDQAKFWEMRDWMQSNPNKLDLDHLLQEAADLKMDMEKFGKCLATDQHRADVEAEIKAGIALGVHGTPSFVIGASGPVIEGQLLVGTQSLEVFEKAIGSVGAKP